jgi:uncharacterized repeat protein (TIGR02543 family)
VIFFPLVTSQIDRQTQPLPLDNSNWWNTSWPYRKLITIDYTKVNAPLTNFPVLIYRSSDADVATKAQPNGQDILFILYSDNTTKLNHEIESYNNTDGNLVAWVNVTSVSSTADTKLWMYYGNSGASNQQNREGTWDAHYVYVQHLNETGGLVYDSTQYNNDGTSYGSMNRSAPGKIDGAYYFDRLDDYVDSTNSSSLYNAMKNAFTVEAWSKTNNFGNWRSTVTKDRSGTGKTSEFWFGWGANNKLDFKFNAATDRYGNTTITNTNWHYIVGNYNGTSMRLYLDGTPDNTPVSVAKVNPSNGSVNLGLTKYWGDNSYGGTLDEVRISDIARNSSWLSTSYKNQNNPASFYSIGAEDQYEYTLTITADPVEGGTIDASPAPPYHYNDVVTLTANANPGYTFSQWTGDLIGSTSPADITMDDDKTVTASFIYTNTPPEANDDSATVNESSSNQQINVLTNDYDPDGDTLIITDVSTPSHGTASIGPGATYCLYTPTPFYNGSDSFTYTISDGNGGTDTATVSMTVLRHHQINVKASWNLISIPCAENISKTNIIINYLGTNYTWAQAIAANIIVDTLFGWNRTGQYYTYGNTLEPGKGYWCWAYYNCTFNFWSNAVMAGQITDLKTGWNMMGLPDETALPITNSHIFYSGTTYTWSQAVTNQIILGFVYGWNQMYTLETIFQPGHAYWMYAYHNCILQP